MRLLRGYARVKVEAWLSDRLFGVSRYSHLFLSLHTNRVDRVRLISISSIDILSWCRANDAGGGGPLGQASVACMSAFSEDSTVVRITVVQAAVVRTAAACTEDTQLSHSSAGEPHLR
jgi:hypothetical protein